MSHNPGWTDEKRSDPGITLVQLFAFLAFAIAFAVTWRLVRNTASDLRLRTSEPPVGGAGDAIEPRSEDRGSGGGGGSRTPVP